MSAKIIDFQARADALTAGERAQVREAMVDFEVERGHCPLAQMELAESPGPSGYSGKPLTAAEVAAVRAMLADFAKIQTHCPLARRLRSER